MEIRKHANSGNPPPAGYICYGCGSKDHWLQDCPTAAANNICSSSGVDKAEKEQIIQEMQKFNKKIEGQSYKKLSIKKIKKDGWYSPTVLANGHYRSIE